MMNYVDIGVLLAHEIRLGFVGNYTVAGEAVASGDVND